MNQEQQPPQQLPSAPFPAPPPFWKHFTISNLEQLKEHDSSTRVPFHLACLRPPPTPSLDSKAYSTFSTEQSLSVAPALPPEEHLLFDPSDLNLDHASILAKITNSLLLNFLELMTVMGNDPTQYADKMQDINMLMINAHALINMYRPHQAREGVREMLEARLVDGHKEIQQCDVMKQKVEAFLREIEQRPIANTTTNGIAAGSKETGIVQDNRRMWEILHGLQNE